MAILATEIASATAGREGKATSPDGKINLNLSPPGSNGPGTNPEQLFAAGYSACFGGAIAAAARLAKIQLRMADIKVTTTVRLHQDDNGYHIDATLSGEIQGVDQQQAETARRQGPHDLPVLKGHARQHRAHAAGQWETGESIVGWVCCAAKTRCMLNLICRKLADLASERIQHRFIRDATKDAYLLPEEAVENADQAIRIARRSTTLSEEQRQAVEEFAAVFEASEPDFSPMEFYDTDPEWIKIRTAAVECLAKLGFDLRAVGE